MCNFPNPSPLVAPLWHHDNLTMILKFIFAESRNNSLSATNNKRLLFPPVKRNWVFQIKCFNIDSLRIPIGGRLLTSWLLSSCTSVGKELKPGITVLQIQSVVRAGIIPGTRRDLKPRVQSTRPRCLPRELTNSTKKSKPYLRLFKDVAQWEEWERR